MKKTFLVLATCTFMMTSLTLMSSAEDKKTARTFESTVKTLAEKDGNYEVTFRTEAGRFILKSSCKEFKNKLKGLKLSKKFRTLVNIRSTDDREILEVKRGKK